MTKPARDVTCRFSLQRHWLNRGDIDRDDVEHATARCVTSDQLSISHAANDIEAVLVIAGGEADELHQTGRCVFGWTPVAGIFCREGCLPVRHVVKICLRLIESAHGPARALFN